AATSSAEVTPSEERLQRLFPREAPPLLAPSRPEPTAPDASPLLVPRNWPKRRTADARGAVLITSNSSSAPQADRHIAKLRAVKSNSFNVLSHGKWAATCHRISEQGTAPQKGDWLR